MKADDKNDRDKREKKPTAINKSPFRERIVKIKGTSNKDEREVSDWLWSLWGDKQ